MGDYPYDFKQSLYKKALENLGKDENTQIAKIKNIIDGFLQSNISETIYQDANEDRIAKYKFNKRNYRCFNVSLVHNHRLLIDDKTYIYFLWSIFSNLVLKHKSLSFPLFYHTNDYEDKKAIVYAQKYNFSYINEVYDDIFDNDAFKLNILQKLLLFYQLHKYQCYSENYIFEYIRNVKTQTYIIKLFDMFLELKIKSIIVLSATTQLKKSILAEIDYINFLSIEELEKIKIYPTIFETILRNFFAYIYIFFPLKINNFEIFENCSLPSIGTLYVIDGFYMYLLNRSGEYLDFLHVGECPSKKGLVVYSNVVLKYEDIKNRMKRFNNIGLNLSIIDYT